MSVWENVRACGREREKKEKLSKSITRFASCGWTKCTQRLCVHQAPPPPSPVTCAAGARTLPLGVHVVLDEQHLGGAGAGDAPHRAVLRQAVDEKLLTAIQINNPVFCFPFCPTHQRIRTCFILFFVRRPSASVSFIHKSLTNQTPPRTTSYRVVATVLTCEYTSLRVNGPMDQ